MKQCKGFVFDMPKQIEEECITRRKIDVIYLLLDTINFILLYPKKMEDVDVNNINNDSETIIILYGKINRVFYCLDSKIISISIPFGHEFTDKKHTFKDYETDLEIDNRLINCLKLLLECYFDIDKVMDILLVNDYESDKWEDILKVFNKLLSYDTGYLRYDYDEERADPDYHPLNHIDVNFDDRSSFKLGLLNKCSFQKLISIIDKNDRVRYLTNEPHNSERYKNR